MLEMTQRQFHEFLTELNLKTIESMNIAVSKVYTEINHVVVKGYTHCLDESSLGETCPLAGSCHQSSTMTEAE